jgi:predicted phosphoribosyltransferase
MVDRFVCLDIPMSYLGAVGMYYMEFSQVTDEEVIELLKAANKK